jgi:quercetin dioxygenase-like cupin family protein
MPADTLASTITALRRHYEQRSHTIDALSIELRRVLALLPAKIGAPLTVSAKSPHPIARHLDAAYATASHGFDDILVPLRRISAYLPWRYSYADADAPGLGERVAWSEFIGPIAPITSDVVCLGITLIAPHTLYPLHRHPAIETYFVLSGTATWTAAGRAEKHPPGTFILHPSNIDHAMETHDEPLLAAYTWSGDVQTLSVYSDK